jgi:GT2 family glycosyltransferase
MTLLNRTAVIVSAHRPYPTLDACLRGFQSIVDREEDLIFVNNGSSASLGNLISESFPKITSITLSQNRLFCAGYNAGIRAALDRNYEFVLIVNADTEVVSPAFIDELLKASVRWPKAAFLGPVVYLRNRNTVQMTQFPFPSLARYIFNWIPWRLLPHLFDRRLVEGKVGYLNGVCVLCRSKALREFGLMDEQYGGYIEDADWSWRARKHGWSSVFIPVPGIIHYEELEGYEHFSFKNLLIKRNTVLWFLKAGRRGSAMLYALSSLVLACLRLLRAENDSLRTKHQRFIQALRKSYRTMLLGTGLPNSLELPKPSEKCGIEI